MAAVATIYPGHLNTELVPGVGLGVGDCLWPESFKEPYS